MPVFKTYKCLALSVFCRHFFYSKGMPFLQKKPLIGTSVPLYTVGLNRTLVIVGLGNPGKEYTATRHNIGFACLDAIHASSDFPAWIHKKDLQAQISVQNVAGTRVILAKPTTFMNRSGEATQAILHFYKLTPRDLLVVHDELDIPFGQIRLRVGGSSAGNNGVASIIQHTGEEFARVRVGIRNEIAEQADGADFVLSKFSKEEQAQLKALTQEVTVTLTEFIHQVQITTETRSFII
ncbi:MAG: Peptidyl-tRNA hydrolase [Candidatus Saccharibacteria bacterium]|nr:Peptidyl-tRNA hydrolase [Candidatus Saccharibacteria bacterium]